MATLSVQQRTAADGGCLVKHDGIITINWQDGGSQDFNTIEELNAYLQSRLGDIGIDQLKVIQLVNCLANDPLLDSPTVWDGKRITFDPEAALFSNVLTQS